MGVDIEECVEFWWCYPGRGVDEGARSKFRLVIQIMKALALGGV